MWWLEVLAIGLWKGGGGGAKSFHSLKGGGGESREVLPCLEWGGAKSFRPAMTLWRTQYLVNWCKPKPYQDK